MLSELIRETSSKRFPSYPVSLPTYYLETFRGYSELIKIAEKKLLSEMNKNRRNSRLRTRPSCAPLNTSNNSRVAHNSSTVNTRRRHLFPSASPSLSSLSLSKKKKKEKVASNFSGVADTLEMLHFLARFSTSTSLVKLPLGPFQLPERRKSDAIRVQYTRFPLPFPLFLFLSFRLFRSFSQRHT